MSDLCCSAHTVHQSLVPVGIFVSSFLGSLHCVGMCGGLVVGTQLTTPLKLAAYHLGRGVSYMGLGALLGSFSGLIPYASHPTVKALTTWLFVGIMGILIVSVWQGKGLKLPMFQSLSGWMASVVGKQVKYNTVISAFLIGLVTIFLPCGWLYAFLVPAAMTGLALKGALLMFAFWLGTVPALSLVGVVSHTTIQRFLSKSPKGSAIVLAFVTVYMVMERL